MFDMWSLVVFKQTTMDNELSYFLQPRNINIILTAILQNISRSTWFAIQRGGEARWVLLYSWFSYDYDLVLFAEWWVGREFRVQSWMMVIIMKFALSSGNNHAFHVDYNLMWN